MIIQGKKSRKNNYNLNLHYLQPNGFLWLVFKYVREGREWREWGRWWATQQISRKRRGGWEGRLLGTLKNAEKKVNDVRRRSRGSRAAWRTGGEKMGVWPEATLEQQQEQSSTSLSHYFLFLVAITEEGAWSAPGGLSLHRPEVRQTSRLNLPGLSHKLCTRAFPLYKYKSTSIIVTLGIFVGIKSCKHKKVTMWPREAQTAFICFHGSNIPFQLEGRKEGNHPGSLELLINFAQYAAMEGK